MCNAKRHVCFTPESDIKRDTMECLLWAKSGHHRGVLSASTYPDRDCFLARVPPPLGTAVFVQPECIDPFDVVNSDARKRTPRSDSRFLQRRSAPTSRWCLLPRCR